MSNYLESTAIDPAWIIGDHTPDADPVVSGAGFGSKGFVERDVDQYPVYGASPSAIKTYPREDWPAMLEEQNAKEASLWHVRERCGPGGGRMPFLNQGSYPYCWKHSAAHSIMLQRGVANEPYVALSAFSLCPTVHSGGWAALAYDFAMKSGCAPQSVVPQGRDAPAPSPTVLAAMAPFKISEGWWDAGQHPGLRNLTFDQLFTLLWDGVPCPVEFNWWGHSVLGLRIVDLKTTSDPKDLNRYALDILNSWANYGVNGVGRLSGSKKIPNSSVGLTSASAG